MGGKCICCGYNKCTDALDLHHLNPEEKEFSMGAIRGNPKNWKSIVEEMKKCVLVCNRCHHEIHAGVTELPEDYAKFDEKYADYRRIGKYDSCPVCGNEKPLKNKTCSRQCAAKVSGKVDWEKVDIIKLVEDDNMTFVAISEMLDISITAVRKRYLKIKSQSHVAQC